MNTIKNLRERLGLSQEELADQSGISRVYLSKIENMPNLTTVSIGVAQRIAGALAVSLDLLIKGYSMQDAINELERKVDRLQHNQGIDSRHASKMYESLGGRIDAIARELKELQAAKAKEDSGE